MIANSGYHGTVGAIEGVPPERIIVVPPGVEPDRFDVPLDGAAAKEPWKVKVGRLFSSLDAWQNVRGSKNLSKILSSILSAQCHGRCF